MILAAEVVAYLADDNSVSAIVEGRVYPNRRPLGAVLPCITYSLVSRGQVYSHDGRSNLEHPVLQFACQASTALEAARLAEAVRRSATGMGQAGFVVGGGTFPSELDADIYAERVDIEIWRALDTEEGS